MLGVNSPEGPAGVVIYTSPTVEVVPPLIDAVALF
jgi:hypothetical protein